MLAGDDSTLHLREKNVEAEADQVEATEAEKLGIHFPLPIANKNLVFIGDSVDRQATARLCDIYGEQLHPAKLLGTELDFEGGYGQHVCHLPKYNSTILFRAHAGAMRVNDEPNWAKIAEQYTWSGRNPQVVGGYNKIEPMWKQKEQWMIKNMLDELPKRTVVFVVQSSLWDSVHAAELLWRAGLPYTFNQDPNNMQQKFAAVKGADQQPAFIDGRGWKGNTDSINAWDWDQKATELVSQVRGAGVPFDFVIWRTNANCPPDDGNYEGYEVGRDYNNFIDRVHAEMAGVAREKVASQEGVWNGTKLMDWRGAVDARSNGWCNGVHYQPPAYDNYIQTLFTTINDAYSQAKPAKPAKTVSKK